MTRHVKIAPSILAADFLHLGAEIEKIKNAGADMIHFDIMDAHFVPNLSLGIAMLEQIRKATDMYLDAHLMMDNPEKYIKTFADAGADGITIHLEIHPEPDAILDAIGSLGKDRGLSINPDMPVEQLKGRVGKVDRLLIMSVFPGFGGQSFIPESLDRLRQARTLLDSEGREKTEIQIDGGVSAKNAAEIVRAGADCLVAGTGFFKAANPADAVRQMRGA
ncbi:MAG: ribulose-phosphate 3-epimerase [Planctomycetota bacterium]|nr:ribulose-phosphate 3-epimerase [Planctomycetota bacterium]